MSQIPSIIILAVSWSSHSITSTLSLSVTTFLMTSDPVTLQNKTPCQRSRSAKLNRTTRTARSRNKRRKTLRQIDRSCCSSDQVTTAPHWLRWRVCAQVNESDLTEDDRGERGRTICGLVCVFMCVWACLVHQLCGLCVLESWQQRKLVEFLVLRQQDLQAGLTSDAQKPPFIPRKTTDISNDQENRIENFYDFLGGEEI